MDLQKKQDNNKEDDNHKPIDFKLRKHERAFL